MVNQSSVITATASATGGALLVQADGTSPGTVTQRLRGRLGRPLAIVGALGDRARRVGGFVCGESVFVTDGGLIVGTVAAAAVSDMFVNVLSGVFDQRPDAPSPGWLSLGGVIVPTGGAVGTAAATTLRALRRPAIEALDDLKPTASVRLRLRSPRPGPSRCQRTAARWPAGQRLR